MKTKLLRGGTSSVDAFLGWAMFVISLLYVFVAKAQTCSAPGGGGGGGVAAPTCFVQYKVSEMEMSKWGFTEYTWPNVVNPPRISVYHNQEIQTLHTYTFNQSGTNGYYLEGDGCMDVQAGNGPYYMNISDSTTFTEQDYCPPFTGLITNTSFSGLVTHDDEGEDQRSTTHSPDGDGCDTCGFTTTYNYGKDDWQYAPEVQDGIWVGAYQETYTNWSLGQTECEGPLNPASGFSTNYAKPPVSVVSYADELESFGQNYEDWDMSAPRNTPGSDYTQSETGSQTWTESSPYDDSELRNNIISQMPPYPSDWYTPGPFGGPPSAFSLIDGTHDNGGAWYPFFSPQGNAMLQKIQYQFCVPDSQAGTIYTINYDVITQDFPNADPTTSHRTATVYGTGDPVNPATAYGGELLAPDWDQTMYPWGGIIYQWVDNVSISIGSSGPGIPAGNGPTIGSKTGCSSCGGGISPGSHEPSLFAQFSLGQATNGFALDHLTLSSGLPTLTLATPAALTLPSSTELEIIQLSNQIRQITAPQAFVDIVTNNAFSYDIRFYYRSQRGSLSGGLYSVSGDPFVTWTVENPDASTNTFSQLRLTETRGADVKEYDYSFTGSTNTSVWKMDYPGGLREDEWGETVVLATNAFGGIATNLQGPTYYTRYVTNIIRTPGGPDEFKSLDVYSNNVTINYGGGSGHTFAGYEALVSETIDPDNNPKTTTYTYYSGVLPVGSTKPVQLVVHPNGNWEYYDYSVSGTYLRISDIYSGTGDEPPPGPFDEPDVYHCRHVEYNYDPIDGTGDDGSMFPMEPREIDTLVNNWLVSVRYSIPSPGERDDIQCVDMSNAGYNNPTNLVTVTKYFTNGAAANFVKSVQNPDGTMSLYQYGFAADGSQTNYVFTGQPNSGQTAIVDGTESVTVIGPFGQMISYTEIDIASGIVLTDDVYGNYDDLNRPQIVTHLDGTSEQTQYACCGVDNTTDRDGVTTQYLYDQMKRQVGSTRLNITTTNILDAAGDTLGTIRIGADSSQIVMNQAAYDVGRQMISQTNALGGVTSYVHTTNSSTGARVEITINSDGGAVTNLYYVDGSLKEFFGSAVHGARYEYDSGSGYTTTAEIKLNADGSDTLEAVTNYFDAVGRDYQTMYSDGFSESQSFYNALGQLWKTVDPDGVVTLFQYNGKGEREYTAIDMDRNDTIDFNGVDRITRTVNDVTTDNSVNVRRSRVYGWAANGVDSSTLLSTSETSADGLRSWQTQYRDASTPVTSQSITVYLTGGNRYMTNTAPDGSSTVSAYINGRLSSVTQKDSTGSQIGSTSYTYDAHGRQYSSTDARNGATIYSYNNADLISSATTPSPGNGLAAQTTTTYYDTSLRATNVVNPDGGSVVTEYLPTGELLETYGSRTYPVAYMYDYAGRMKTMKTWQNFAGNSGTATTTWSYDGCRGFLTNKTYDGGAPGPGYTYTPGGRLQSRTWARGITTTYNYDNSGGLANIAYSDGVTSSVTNTFDRLGRTIQVGTANLVTQYSYNSANELLVETNTAGMLAGLAVTNGYDAYLRRTNLFAVGSGVLSHTAYTYDAGSRLFAVSDGTNNVTYTYVANSPLVSQLVFKSNSVTEMTTTKTYDYLNRLMQISNAPSASAAVSFSYQYDSANQRTKATLVDGSYWVYQYDALGQVMSGKKYWADGTPVAGQQFEYSFDDIGNRTQTKAGGDETGSNLRIANYTDNTLNQISSRDVPAYVDIMGIAMATNTVTVNGQTVYRKGEYFRNELSVNNSSTAVWTNITVMSPGQSSINGNKFLPKTQEVFGYDADGNLTNDGRWAYTWDGENRLIKMTVNTNVGPQYQLVFLYDALGRRMQKVVSTNNVGIYTNNSIYDGWNLVAEVAPNNGLVRSYMWGMDLSGTMQGAGGVGGLLVMGIGTTNCFFGYDGGANVSMLVDAAGTTHAVYEYGPFGELIRANGTMADTNPTRFSTKYQDQESGKLYYGFRIYDSLTGAWLSRDPMGDLAFDRQVDEGRAGENYHQANEWIFSPYAFVDNNPISRYDKMGLCSGGSCGPDITQTLIRTLLNVDREWSLRDPVAQKKVCDHFISANGWEITDLLKAKFNSPCGEAGSCQHTVTINNTCYLDYEVNYVIFGKMCSLCKVPQWIMDGLILYNKDWYKPVVLHQPYDHQFRGALAWANAGYVGWPNSQAPYSDESSCSPCSYQYPGVVFTWHAGGMGHREGP